MRRVSDSYSLKQRMRSQSLSIRRFDTTRPLFCVRLQSLLFYRLTLSEKGIFHAQRKSKTNTCAGARVSARVLTASFTRARRFVSVYHVKMSDYKLTSQSPCLWVLMVAAAVLLHQNLLLYCYWNFYNAQHNMVT